jgi:hypothetical protein
MPQDLARLLVKRDGDDDGPSVHTLQRVRVPCRCCDLPFLPGHPVALHPKLPALGRRSPSCRRAMADATVGDAAWRRQRARRTHRALGAPHQGARRSQHCMWTAGPLMVRRAVLWQPRAPCGRFRFARRACGRIACVLTLRAPHAACAAQRCDGLCPHWAYHANWSGRQCYLLCAVRTVRGEGGRVPANARARAPRNGRCAVG